MTTDDRIAWVDTAKGLCIVLVVMMHSTLGVEKYSGVENWLHAFIEWARPFRMPDFFMISGLFLARRIDRPWRRYLDSKVAHFAYFYVLWMTIQFAVKAPGLVASEPVEDVLATYFIGFVDPESTLWFIYLLAVFFVATRLLGPLNRWIVLAAAVALEMMPIETGNTLIDEFAGRFVYFYGGYVFASRVMGFARRVDGTPWPTVAAGLLAWGLLNGLAVAAGVAPLPGVSLALGTVGAFAVVSMGVLLSRHPAARGLRYCGANSLVIYLAFFLFMAASRKVLLATGVIADMGLASLVVTAAGVAGPLLLFHAVRSTPLAFLFSRPSFFRLSMQAGPDLAAA